MNNIKLFESKKVRSHWDAGKEMWCFSIIDVVEILTGSSIPKRYWSDLRRKLASEGSEVYEKIVRLKMQAEDGKMRETDVADTETLLRLIQSIPSLPPNNKGHKNLKSFIPFVIFKQKFNPAPYSL